MMFLNQNRKHEDYLKIQGIRLCQISSGTDNSISWTIFSVRAYFPLKVGQINTDG